MRRLLTLLFLAAAVTVSAQVPDSKGTDFWFTFMPNYHNFANTNQFNSPAWRLGHQLYVYIGAEVPTRGTITLRDRNGIESIVSFNIPNPADLYEFKTFYAPYELDGFNKAGDVDFAAMDTEKPAQQSFHIESDNEVTVYALTQGSLTSDAFLVLPTDALSTDYVVTSYTSDFYLDGSGAPTGPSTPSQFAIVATEDATIVTIDAVDETMFSVIGQSQRVELQRGESFLVQANPNALLRDLTGSKVRSDKPIAVFGGHQRALLPIEDRANLGSRDVLVEQLNPIVTWGKSAFVTPLEFSSDEFRTSNNIYRVVAAFDSTVVFRDMVEHSILDAGEFVEIALTRAEVVNTSRPASVAMFKKSAGPGTTGSALVSDPFMMMVPPAEQFLDSYRFVNVQAYLYRDDLTINDKIYYEQWLNVVIPTVSVSSLILDGQPITSQFFQIGNSTYSWASVRMGDGVHEISADTTFGIYVYGYGEANSYGYIGGMAFRPLDIYPPEISGRTVCGVFSGNVVDSLLGDTRVMEVSVVPGSEQNVVFTLGAFAPPQAVVPFQAALIDPLEDGSVSLEARDQVLQSTRTTIIVPGFTVGPEGAGPDPNPVIRRRVLPIGQLRCDTLTLENYGGYSRTISVLRSSQGGDVTEPVLPYTIRPGERVDVVVCRTLNERGIQYDTLLIGDSCLTRTVLEVEFDVKDDDESPSITGKADACSTLIEVTIADDRPFDFGIESFAIIDSVLVNCIVSERSSNAMRAVFDIEIIDPFQDAIYGFVAIDSGGNANIQIDTIQGFTLAVNGEPGVFSIAGVEDIPLGTVFCDSIILTNYGFFDQVIYGVYMRGNVQFSLPQEQFTIVVPPGGSYPLEVCYEPFTSDTARDIDTLEFIFGCAVKRLEIQGTSKAVIYAGLTRCNVPVSATTLAIGEPLTLMPQPATNNVTIVLNQESAQMKVKVIDLQGALQIEYAYNGEATRSVRMDIRDIPAGTYGVVVVTETSTHSAMLVVQ